MTFLANLARHSAAVNCVRYNHQGNQIASAGDGTRTLIKMVQFYFGNWTKTLNIQLWEEKKKKGLRTGE